ncbi:MMPL family transporter [Tengunoibacter tsumagoiensis]|uniref:Membrane protein n=1 Tax=Tengunoibacter tsumagoiensis TaxID=2014871 RepID=A0A402A954_9CHLR|nr:MMPL family transporter [Tengunoibacter tsumagoiensis]GCE15659.1 membrane protein [Tengunoibacter tsumagoiensis]
MLKGLGGLLHRFRWSVLALTIVITVLAAYYGIGVFDTLKGASINDPGSEAIQAGKLIGSKLSSSSTDVVVLLSSPTLQASDDAFKQAVDDLQQKLQARSEVDSVTSYYTDKSAGMLSRDQHEILMLVNLSSDGAGKMGNYKNIAPLFTSPTLTVNTGGTIVSDIQFNDQTGADLQYAELVTLPIIALLLFLIFGGVIAALLPLIIGIFAIIGSFAILRLLSNFMEISSFAVDVVAFMGLGLAIDYSLFIVTRFREELLLNENDVRIALHLTLASAGRTVLFSGLTVGTSLICLLIFPEVLLRSIGLAAISSALVAMLASLLVLPALLAIFGLRINALSLNKVLRRRPKSVVQDHGAWYTLAKFVMRFSIPVTLVIVAFVLFLGTPFLHATFSSPDERSLPEGRSARVVQEHLKKNFVGQGVAEMDIAITTSGDVLSADNLALLQTYVARLQATPHVTSVLSLTSVDPRLTLKDYQQLYAHPESSPELAKVAKQLANGNVTEVIVTTDAVGHSDQAHALVGTIRDVAVPSGITRLIGGTNAVEADLFKNIEATIPWALSVMAIAILILLFLLTGSIIMPIKAIILNTLSLSATFGVLVWGFQDGNLQKLLHFQSIGSLDSTQTILIFALAFGLSMDYEVFLLSRIREQFDLTHSNREAVALGLQRTGGLITSAAILLAVVIGAFATSKIIFIQEIGVGVALAVLMDATLIRSLLVPAMMSLLGSANWWAPRPLRALWSVIGLRESEQSTLEQRPVPSELFLQDSEEKQIQTL